MRSDEPSVPECNMRPSARCGYLFPSMGRPPWRAAQADAKSWLNESSGAQDAGWGRRCNRALAERAAIVPRRSRWRRGLNLRPPANSTLR